ncbi:hypothetical protein BKN38_06140 [Helicobacter sp. CLO-3]|uniref:epoxyqueuosine reductase QueH n=1 Tax=unclassified Helicobacter TaxID=2593540 RepID=UPI000805951D|nr:MULTISPECIES: epoxyqueuosine reductase QueH [unclassified Helicobacter]OBV28371.1 hypothetical protein BA723_09645 [Helicobacter sp. CLO-3]OHU82933.1 hypothetical protein BKN38_06140 [Helicobacter sp. CLO-3]
MLVHICCSVDSHYFLSELQKEFPGEKFTGFFYNPNIHPKSEHDLRLSDVRRSCEMLGISLIEGKYDDTSWCEGVRGLENEPEKGDRCVRCFDIRLEESAKIALELGEQRFTTTLLSSPMKEQEVLYQQGDQIAQMHGLDFIKINVRSNGGVQRQNELAKKDNLYRQNYCGCKYALTKQREKQERFSLESISEIGRRALPGSIEERQETFDKRNHLERNGRDYILTQRKMRIYRLLWGKISYNDAVIPSYILAHSDSRSARVGAIVWIKTSVKIPNNARANLLNPPAYLPTNSPTYSSAHSPAHLQGFRDTNALDSGLESKKVEKSEKVEKSDSDALHIHLGFGKKDDALFICMKDFNKLACSAYKRALDMLYHPPRYEVELDIRACICGSETTNPIIIIDKPTEQNLKVEIKSLFQEEKVFCITEAAR